MKTEKKPRPYFESETLLDKESEKVEKHLRDFNSEERRMIKLMANIFVKNILKGKKGIL